MFQSFSRTIIRHKNIHMRIKYRIINLREVEESFPFGAKWRMFGAVPAFPRVLSRRKLGKRNIYFSPNNSSHGHVTLLF